MSKLRKIPIDMQRPLVVRGRKQKGRTVKLVRKESNVELLHMAILKRGSARLNIQLRIRHHEEYSYCAWQGFSIMVDVPTIAAAQEFKKALADAITTVAHQHRLKIEVGDKT